MDLSRYYVEVNNVPPPPFDLSRHPIYGYLKSQNRIESMRIYNCRNATIHSSSGSKLPVCICLIKLGPYLEGHQGIVHGGVLSMLIDEVIGLGCEALGDGLQGLAFTANLNINYRNPCPVCYEIRTSVYLQKYDGGRKLKWTCVVESSDQKTLYCEATSLFLLSKEMEKKKKSTTTTSSPKRVMSKL